MENFQMFFWNVRDDLCNNPMGAADKTFVQWGTEVLAIYSCSHSWLCTVNDGVDNNCIYKFPPRRARERSQSSGCSWREPRFDSRYSHSVSQTAFNSNPKGSHTLFWLLRKYREKTWIGITSIQITKKEKNSSNADKMTHQVKLS